MSRFKSYGLATGSQPHRSTRPAFLLSRLTPQENRVLALACDPSARQEIASRLQLNEQEVQHCLQKVADKMGLSDCAALIDYIRQHEELIISELCREEFSHEGFHQEESPHK
jgi:DNA-binding NarL/FixJ family response regulator